MATSTLLDVTGIFYETESMVLDHNSEVLLYVKQFGVCAVITSRVIGQGNRIGPVRLSFRLCVCLYLWSVCVDPSWQKDFGAKELYNTGRGRCINAQAFSF